MASIALALVARRVSPLEIRANLRLDRDGLGELFLTSLAEDPERVLVTTRRENSTWARDMQSQAGNTFWVRRYGDPARPGLPERILLTSRSRGARLLIPLAALDLENALAAPVGEDPEAPSVPRRELVQVHLDRSFAGLFLELSFRERELDPETGEPLDRDFAVVRGNRVRTTDFLLQPNGRWYKDAIIEGLQPTGTLVRHPGEAGELVLHLGVSLEDPAEPLFVPLSLFDELGLCWGTELPTIVDDRWRVEDLPAFELLPASTGTRSLVERIGARHLAARLESAEERRLLARELEGFAGA